MRTSAFIILSGLLVCSGLNTEARDFRYGILAGFDVASGRMTNKPDLDVYSKYYYPMFSFNANGYLGYRSSGWWGLSAEPGFIQKGGIKKAEGEDIAYRLNCIQLPVLAEWHITDRWFLSAGPELSYMINAKRKSGHSSIDVTDYYDQRFEVSGLIGIDYSVTKFLDIGLRYNHGLTYTSKFTWTDEMGLETGVSKEFNQYFQVILRCAIIN